MSMFQKLGLVGSAALASLGPLGVFASAAINVFLDDDDKVTETDTVDQVEAKFAALPEDQRAQVMDSYYTYLSEKVISDNGVATNKEDNYTEQLRIMETSDQQIMARPNITKWMAIFIIVISFIILSAHTVDVLMNSDVQFDTYLVGAMLFLPTWVIQKYFDRRSGDKITQANLLAQKPTNVPQKIGAALLNKVLQ